MTRRLRLGMVGGGRGAFIGAVHRFAARLDGDYELVAGAFSADPEKGRASAEDLGIAPGRAYASWEEMARAEAARPDGIEVVSIVTPNHLHFGPAKAFLEAGIHVICDKPLTSTLEDARALARILAARMVGGRPLVFGLTHAYAGYPLVRQAREMVARGDLGPLRIAQVEYPQDWLTEPAEDSGNKQALWRMDPANAGEGGAVGDIGTHAYHLLRHVTGLKLEALSADLRSFGPGRRLDDDVQAMLRFRGGARGMLWASQIAPGHENGLRLRVYGAKGGLEWAQEAPNQLWFSPYGEPRRLLTRGGAGASPGAASLTRTPAGHPEGYLEAFANLYQDYARAIRRVQAGGSPETPESPGLAEGLEGMAFIDACLRSSRADAAWTAPSLLEPPDSGVPS
ncbi:Gfo/Idh/MocA family oxidoreductase [Neomegalonema sp.]|uniref:Gfo/Idh/MocA family protein n=1 Tax=Neomegalonema sp. TaxID=2039713 RepID=UPI00260D4FCC|nr:Gfo/Idh/MocA family oxidoreductase [Neomegalonema sp.]MDD2869507.1 Gfo/Idh/MocA family oxidoreductase [Neomegalonema sp.]